MTAQGTPLTPEVANHDGRRRLRRRVCRDVRDARAIHLESGKLPDDVPTLALLFGMMVLSAQLRLGGVYGAVTRRVARASVSPRALLALVVALVGVLAAVFTNDIVTLAVTPPVLRLSRARDLNRDATTLALASTLAGNLLIVGSIANIIVVEEARRHGVTIDWRTPARVGVPVTLVTLGLAALALGFT